MNVKQIIAASLLMVPVAAASLSAKPASANEAFTRRTVTERTVFVNHPSHENHFRREFFRHRRVWIPGHWEFNRFGHRYWVSGYYVFR